MVNGASWDAPVSSVPPNPAIPVCGEPNAIRGITPPLSLAGGPDTGPVSSGTAVGTGVSVGWAGTGVLVAWTGAGVLVGLGVDVASSPHATETKAANISATNRVRNGFRRFIGFTKILLHGKMYLH